MRSSKDMKEDKDKVDVDRVLNDIRSLRSRLFEMSPIVTTPPADDLQGSKLTLSRLGGPTSKSGSRISPIKERPKFSSKEIERERERERDLRSKLSSPNVLKNRSLELKKSLLLDSETDDNEGNFSDIPSNADQDRAFSDSEDELAPVFQNGKHRSHSPNLPAASRPPITNSSPPVTRRSAQSKEDLMRQLEDTKKELKRRSKLEKDFQEVGEGLRKLATERENEIEELNSENSHLKSLLKSMEADLKRYMSSQKNLEKDLATARKSENELRSQTVDLEAKLQFETQRNTKLLARLRASEITADMEGLYQSQFSQSGPLPSLDNDERDILINKLKGLVSELQSQLANASMREKDRSGEVADDARRLKDELDRSRAECTMLRDIKTRSEREIQSLEHELQAAQLQVRRLSSDLDSSTRNLKDLSRSEREKLLDEKKREEDIRKLEDEAMQLEADLKSARQTVYRLEDEVRRLSSSNLSYTAEIEELQSAVASLTREKKELGVTIRLRDDDLHNSRASFLDAEKELVDMSHQMESLTAEVMALRDTAADAETHKKLAMIAGDMRERAARSDDELRQATIHFQKELVRQEREYNDKVETERTNHLDALVTINQEKERAEKTNQDLQSLLHDKDDEVLKLRNELNIMTALLDDKSKNLRHYMDMEHQIERQLSDLNSELNSSSDRERRMADEINLLKDEISMLQNKNTEYMTMISSREKRETATLDKLKQSDTEIQSRTKDLRRLARALKLQEEKMNKLQEDHQAILRDKDIVMAELNAELEKKHLELSNCVRSIAALEDEVVHLRRESDRNEHELRNVPDLEHELRVKTEETTLLQREVVRLQGVVRLQQKQLAEMDKALKTADSKITLHRDLSNRKSEDVSNLQQNVSTLTTKLKSQLDNLMRLQATPPPTNSPLSTSAINTSPIATRKSVNLSQEHNSPQFSTKEGRNR